MHVDTSSSTTQKAIRNIDLCAKGINARGSLDSNNTSIAPPKPYQKLPVQGKHVFKYSKMRALEYRTPKKDNGYMKRLLVEPYLKPGTFRIKQASVPETLTQFPNSLVVFFSPSLRKQAVFLINRRWAGEGLEKTLERNSDGGYTTS